MRLQLVSVVQEEITVQYHTQSQTVPYGNHPYIYQPYKIGLLLYVPPATFYAVPISAFELRLDLKTDGNCFGITGR